MNNSHSIPNQREKGIEQLRAENELLQIKLEDSQEIIRAIREGAVDALVIDTSEGQRVFTLEGKEYLYRILIEQMLEGAVTLTSDGVIHFCNRRFAEMLKLPMERIIGGLIEDFIAEEDRGEFGKMLDDGGRKELILTAGDDSEVPAMVSVISLKAKGPAAICLVVTELTERKQHEAEILKLNRDLEKRISERTIQLSMANRELTSEISQREKAEYLQRQNEQHLNDILSSIQDGFFELDRDWNFIYINEKAAQNIGKEPEELIGKILWDEFPGILGTPHELSYKNAMFGREVQQFEMEGVLTKGWYSITVYPSSEGVSVFWQDVTKRKEAEEALLESEERYRHLVKFAPAGIYEIDFTTGHFTEVNEEMCRILGYTRDELLSMHAEDILDDEGKAHFAERLRKIQAGEEPADKVEYKIRTKEGKFVWGLINYTFNWENGKIVGATAVAYDITERKLIEKKLKESEQHYRQLVESSNSIILKADKDLNITFINDFGLKFFGYSEDEILGKSALGTIIPLKDSEGHDLGSMTEGIRLHPEKFRANVNQNMRKDGSLVWVSWTNNAKLDENRNLIELFSIGNDLSKLKETEKALQESENKYRQLVEGANSIILKTNKDTNITFINEFGIKFFGYSLEELLGKPTLGKIVPVKDSEGHDLSDMPEDLRRHPDKYETNIHENMRKDGRLVWVSWTNRPIYDENGNLIEFLSIGNDLSELKETQKALKESEERFRLFMDNSPTMAWIKDEQGKYVYLTKNFERNFGIKLKDRLGKTDAELWPPEIADEFRKNDLEVLVKNKPIQVAEKTINPDGSICYWLNVKFPLKDASGNLFVAGIGLDITERKNAEEALRESEDRLRRVAHAGKIGLYEWNVNRDNAYWSPEAYELFGVEPDSPANLETWLKCVHPDDREKSKRNIAKAIEQAHDEVRDFSLRDEYRVIHKDGTVHWLEAFTTFDLDDGELNMRGAIRDITERKQAEEALRVSEERFRTLLKDVKSVAVQGYSSDGTTQYWNKASEQLYGYSAQEAIGKNLIDLIIPPEMREDVKITIRQMAETGQPIPASELSLMRKDGSRVPVFSNHAIVNVPGQTQELFCIVIDLTEQKKAEDKILLHMEELSAANEDLEHFNREMVGRELRMIELKKEINELRAKAGQPPLYKLDSEEE